MTPATRFRMPFVEIPPGILPAATNRSETYRLLAGIALKHSLAPIMVDLAKVETAVIFIHPVQIAKIERIAEEYKISLQSAFAGLCSAAIEKLHVEMKQHIKAEKEYVKTNDLTLAFPTALPAQKKFFTGIMKGLHFNKVVLAEASTGIGKGRAMMMAAMEMIKQGKKPVVVAAPTIQVMTQLYGEYEALCEENEALKDVPLVILPGRAEFVDSHKLRHFLDDAMLLNGKIEVPPEDIGRVREWVEAGGFSVNTEEKSALAKTMQKLGLSPAWLADDLREITANFPVDTFLLCSDSDRDCDAEVLLKDYKARISLDADIIICTHAMLAIGQRNQWNPAVLPQPAVLLIDEAHQFEQTMAQFNSEQLSLFSLRWRLSSFIKAQGLGSGTVASKAVKETNTIIGLCRNCAHDDMIRNIRLDAPPGDKEVGEYGQILSKLTYLKKLIKSKTLEGMEDVDSDRKALAALVLAIEKGGDYKRIHCSFSPSKSYPSIQAGTADMGQQLGHLWKSAEGGVVLASATLFVPEPDGSQRSDYLRDILSLPLSRIYEVEPVEVNYIYSLPILHFPSLEKCKALSPPKLPGKSSLQKDFAESEKKWLANLAQEIAAGPLQHAVGGTLILCTSYTQLSALTNKLPELGVDPARLVVQERNKKFGVTKEDFIAAHRAGLRPVLIALGLAWTGLDLLDKTVGKDEAHKDTLLTDLVIVRCPLGLNKSTTMLIRIEGRGVDPISKEALLMFKQGLGRLIRRDGVKDRHLWIMDGRLWTEWEKMERFSAAARSLLGKYKNHKEF